VASVDQLDTIAVAFTTADAVVAKPPIAVPMTEDIMRNVKANLTLLLG